MRHGEAQAYAQSDALRPLTDAGRAQVAQTVSSRQRDLQSLETLITSPYLRAKQTTEIVLENLPNTQPRVLESELITPDGEPDKVIEFLQASAGPGSTLLVFHQPLITRLAEKLCALPRGQIFVPTATLLALRCEILAWGLGELQWITSP